MVVDMVKVFAPATAAFLLGIAATPVLTHYLYKYRAWKKKAGKVAPDGSATPIFNKLHESKEVGTPRMGGIVVWASSALTILGFWVLAQAFPKDIFSKLDFLSRDQTWIPLFTLLVGSLVGLADDLFEISGRGGYLAGGLSIKKRLLIVGAVALFVGYWFFAKLCITGIALPFSPETFELGWLIVPFFITITLALYASGVIDGIDGLSGGVFATIFSAYAILAFSQEQINLAAFSAMLVGALLAFLWFNIPPARFYMSETGTMGLTVTLAVVAFMTDSLGDGIGVSVLPIIALPLVATVLSVVVQLLSKKFRGKKVFLVAPLHHHFEAIGWPGYKVTMRYWVISVMCAIVGVMIALVG